MQLIQVMTYQNEEGYDGDGCYYRDGCSSYSGFSKITAQHMQTQY